MTRSAYPRSVAKYIRRQKSRIRRTAPTKEEANKRIHELLATIQGSKHHETT